MSASLKIHFGVAQICNLLNAAASLTIMKEQTFSNKNALRSNFDPG